MDSVNMESINQYFNLLEKTMLAHNILRSPNQIYNMDETGMPLSPCTPRQNMDKRKCVAGHEVKRNRLP